MTSILTDANTLLEIVAQNLKDMHPDWTWDRPIR